MYITTNKIKQQLNIESGYTDEDSYLQYLAEVAEDAVEGHIAQPLSGLCSTNLETGEVDITTLPSSLQHAILLLISNFYANRESISFATPNKIPLSYEYLLDNYINYANK